MTDLFSAMIIHEYFHYEYLKISVLSIPLVLQEVYYPSSARDAVRGGQCNTVWITVKVNSSTASRPGVIKFSNQKNQQDYKTLSIKQDGQKPKETISSPGTPTGETHPKVGTQYIHTAHPVPRVM
jgi:hypothetical protein